MEAEINILVVDGYEVDGVRGFKGWSACRYTPPRGHSAACTASLRPIQCPTGLQAQAQNHPRNSKEGQSSEAGDLLLLLARDPTSYVEFLRPTRSAFLGGIVAISIKYFLQPTL